jgi:ectoine hydroxylase-related dioxygenase (phytanoyl-CoA dioxygenase family)
MLDAASKEGIEEKDVEVVSMEGLTAGGLSLHDGLCWHGSGKNVSKYRSRRGIGIHFVPADVKFVAEDAAKSSLWRKYVKDCDGLVEVPEEDFPITYKP